MEINILMESNRVFAVRRSVGRQVGSLPAALKPHKHMSGVPVMRLNVMCT